MPDRFKRLDVAEAMGDLQERTLAGLPCELAKLVYLASTRDYNCGRYYHDGLSFQYTTEVAEAALHSLHKEIFQKLLFTPLKNLVGDLETFIRASHSDSTTVLDLWKKLEPYRVVIPQDSDTVSRELFFSNIRIALAILGRRQAKGPHQDQQSASLPQ